VTKARCRKHPGTNVTTKSHTCTLNLHRASLSHGITLAPPVRFDDRHHTRESLDGFVHCVVGFSFVAHLRRPLRRGWVMLLCICF
jgi:hypothetical protein